MRAARFLASDTYTPDFAARLDMPLLLIQGDVDRVTPLETNAAILAVALPHARLLVLPRTDHLPDVERWREVNQSVRAFLGAQVSPVILSDGRFWPGQAETHTHDKPSSPASRE